MFIVSTPAGRLRAVPRGELLECRCVPAPLLFEWISREGTANWSDKRNWYTYISPTEWKRADAYPGQNDPGDCVQFANGSTGVAVVDVTNTPATPGKPASLTLGALSIGSTSTATVRLNQALSVSSVLDISGGKVSGPLGGSSHGLLTLASQATGYWQGGNIAAVDFNVASGAKLEIKGAGNRTVGNTTFNVEGQLLWSSGDVNTWYSTTTIWVKSGGQFQITTPTGTIGYTAAPSSETGQVEVVNDAGGTVRVNTVGRATLLGNYRTAGTTTIAGGILSVGGTAEQTAATGSFQLRNWSIFELTKPNEVLRVRDGRIDGNGIVRGSLSLGYESGGPQNSNPIIAPGRDNNGGTIRVEGNFHLYNGELHIHIYGPNAPSAQNLPEYDRVQVVPGANGLGGNASIAGPAGRWRKLVVELMPVHAAIQPTDVLGFLTYTSSVNLNDFSDVQYVGTTADAWNRGQTATMGWLSPKNPIQAVQGKIGGLIWRDNGAVAGVFEPGVEAILAGYTVRLFDSTGTTQLASATTGADGHYLFQNLDAGEYVVQFDRPNSERFAPQNVGSDDTVDSDPDPITGRLAVALYEDQTDIDAGFGYNAAPIAVDDLYYAHKNTSVSGNVLANDSDPDGDPLTASDAASGSPTSGSLTLNPDGSFVFTPATGFVGTTSFAYTVSDGLGGSSTATVTIIVSDTAAPSVGGPIVVRSGRTRTGTDPDTDLPDGRYFNIGGNVLDGVTSPGGGDVTGWLASGPAHGALVFNSDGSFLYTPDDTFVGTDSFTFRPADAGGPGEPVLVQLVVSDHPPTAANDTAAATAGAAVTVDVLGNDADADGDAVTVVGASDGLYGTTAVNADGTVTYTPAAGFVGTDVFTYVTDDGYGRLSYATVTVTVTAAAVPGPQAGGTVWLDSDGDGVRGANEGGVSGVSVQLVDMNGNVVTSAATDGTGQFLFADVTPGQYRIRVVVPDGYAIVPDGTLDADGYSAAFTLGPDGSFDLSAALTFGMVMTDPMGV